jgi:hypothetical protein
LLSPTSAGADCYADTAALYVALRDQPQRLSAAQPGMDIHIYSTYARGLDLEIALKGRDEEGLPINSLGGAPHRLGKLPWRKIRAGKRAKGQSSM